MRLIKIMVLCAGCVALASCATPKSVAYLTPQHNARMTVPRGAQSPMQQPLYVVPRVAVKGRVGDVSLLPPGSNIALYQQRSHKK